MAKASPRAPSPKARHTVAAILSAPSGVSLYDARPFFEKALQYGIEHSLIDTATLDAITSDAPKGMVQIARYFGNEFLRPDLEKARERIVNLVSLYLEHSTAGDLAEAAQSLQQHSFLSRSKAGSDMLKSLITMPQVIALAKDYLPAAVGQAPGLQGAIYGFVLIGFVLFEPLGLYGRWLKLRTYLQIFPFYRKGMFKRQKSFLKSDRLK